MKNEWIHRVERLLRDDWQIAPEERLLLAVSGGRDSSILVHLMLQLGQACALAHVNYGLRGEASERDSTFVEQLARKAGLPFHLYRANPLDFQSNLQAKARSVRYQWFGKLCEEHGYSWVATAHHQQDQAETVLMALLRGRGSKAVAGMQVKQGRRLKPLLDVSTAELELYAAENQIQWVEDGSNADSAYERNYVRNQVKPLLNQRFAGWERLVARQAQQWQQEHALLEEKLQQYRPVIVEVKQPDWHIWKLAPLANLAYADLLLGALAADYDLSQHERASLIKLRALSNGKALDTLHWRVSRIAEGFEWQRKSKALVPFELSIPSAGSYRFSYGRVELAVREVSFVASDMELFDADDIQFPLQLRSWRHGDRLQASGLQGSKKLSDLFNDHKMSPRQKQQSLVLCDAQHILWVVGLRRSIFAPVTDQTKRLLAIKLVYD